MKTSFKIISFLVIFLGLFIFLNKVFSSTNMYRYIFEDFVIYSKESNIDVVFYGSSHSYTTYNPTIISDLTKTTSYNLGSSELHISLTDLVLKESLKHTKPKLVVLDIFEETLREIDGQESKGHQLEALDIVTSYSEKIAFTREVYEPKEYLNVFFPLIRNHSQWNNKTMFNFFRAQPEWNIDHQLVHGFRGYFKNISPTIAKGYKSFNTTKPKKNPSIKLITGQGKNDIVDFVNIAKAQAIDVLVVSAPDLRVPFRNYSFFDEIQHLCDSLNIQFLNLNDYYNEMELTTADFMDIQHLNMKGARKTSQFVGNYINEHFEFQNRSSDVKVDDETFETEVQDSLISSLYVQKLIATRNRSYYNININFDETQLLKEDVEKYNISINIFPAKTDLNKINSVSKMRGWDYEKHDFNLDLNNSNFAVDLNINIENIEKIELFLYNRKKYSGVVGKKLIIDTIIFSPTHQDVK